MLEQINILIYLTPSLSLYKLSNIVQLAKKKIS